MTSLLRQESSNRAETKTVKHELNSGMQSLIFYRTKNIFKSMFTAHALI